MKKTGVVSVINNEEAIASQIKALIKNQVLIGIPAEDADRTPEEGEQVTDNPITNAEIGYVMEFGMPEKNIPARAALVPGVQEAKERLGDIMENGAIKALKGSHGAADIAMNKAGLIAASSVKQKITDGPFEPLSPKTIAARKRRGREGEKPLIDTSQYRNSFTYVIRPKGK